MLMTLAFVAGQTKHFLLYIQKPKNVSFVLPFCHFYQTLYLPLYLSIYYPYFFLDCHLEIKYIGLV